MDVVTLGQAKLQADKRLGVPLAAWARNYRSGPVARFAAMSSPPTVTFLGGTSTFAGYTNGATKYNAQSSVFANAGSIFVDGTSPGSLPNRTPAHITDSAGAKSGQNSPIRVRFQTDAPSMDFAFLDSLFTQFNLVVDGQYLARDRTAVFRNSGQYRYVNVNFGADAPTYGRAGSSFSITAGGTGYAVGDVITLNGGTGGAAGTPTTLVVAQVGAGVVNAVDVVQRGAYTTLPTGTLSQASTTGSGTGFTLSASNFWHADHSTRKMRTIELIYSQPGVFLGLVTNTNDIVIPYPVNPATPKLAIIGDSITNGTYLEYGGSHMGCTIAQKLGMWDKHIISGIGGTGWNTGSTAWSHANRVADYIAYNADVYLFVGSQNDSAGASLQNAITATLNSLTAARPNAFCIGVGNIMGDSTTLANSIGTGWAAANNQRRLAYLNNHAPNKWMPSADLASWAVTGDLNHPNQSGIDKFADMVAQQAYAALMALVTA